MERLSAQQVHIMILRILALKKIVHHAQSVNGVQLNLLLNRMLRTATKLSSVHTDLLLQMVTQMIMNSVSNHLESVHQVTLAQPVLLLQSPVKLAHSKLSQVKHHVIHAQQATIVMRKVCQL